MASCWDSARLALQGGGRTLRGLGQVPSFLHRAWQTDSRNPGLAVHQPLSLSDGGLEAVAASKHARERAAENQMTEPREHGQRCFSRGKGGALPPRVLSGHTLTLNNG